MLLLINTHKILDNLKLNFDDNGLWALYIALAIIMFGVSLEITTEDFRRLFKNPRLVLIGIFSQFVLFPLITFTLVNIINPTPSIALGMILVAACPGGNISNFLTHLSGGNTALSISLTAFATLVAIIMTPLNLAFWGNLYEPTAQILRTVEMNPFELTKLVTLILGVPLFLGMLYRKYRPTSAVRIAKILKPISVFILMLFIAVAFYNNLDIFTEYIQYVIYLVILHNFLGLLGGFYFAKMMKLSYRNQKTMALETGIQNSGLGLLLVFAFFDGLGGMALCVAFWGIWDILSGLVIASYWSKKSKSTKIIV
ncbi:MAG TPA: bile acid:sodium symporter family protein [Flavobacteriia bacterium]|jgi:BASS family bile acid:Na+ symporter|nr:bile acid:sodium symporter family protein [Flavobacteriia bacterium]